ncbi:hypothetical protein V5F77_05420 [Xanthobacter sp. DSM 24535]|uniref:hypothetical protein n=1 Tax=Roseixanthobacter psychrophilus TaxID=3119917 RepID=UPI00372C4550
MDRAIPFKAQMVKAILREIECPGTGKTQTRPVLPAGNVLEDIASEAAEDLELRGWFGFAREDMLCAARINIGAGDRLWVREEWKTTALYDTTSPRDLPRSAPIHYMSHDRLWPVAQCRAGMFMPRWASRITLYATDVRVQRLQDISEEDAWAEGVRNCGEADGGRSIPGEGRDLFRSLWNTINGPGSWDDNPWVCAISFIPRLGNIDALPATLEEAA